MTGPVALPCPITELPTPALLVDRDRLERNLDDVATVMRDAGVALRPHIKTSKCLAVARRQLDRGAIGFTCATAAEVALLLAAGVTDVLWAHQPVGPAKVGFAVEAARSGALTVAVDSVAVAGPLSAAATAAGVVLPYLVEVDTGTGRAGADPARVVDLVRRLSDLPGLRLRGVFTHEGFLARYLGDRTALEAASRDAAATLVAAADTLRQAGYRVDVVSMGSTPGLTSAPYVPGVTEARPGTYVFYDSNQVNLDSAGPAQCALTVLTRVVSRERFGLAIVDAGVKALSSDRSNVGDGLGLVCDVSGVPLAGVSMVTAHEEHGFLGGPGVDGLEVGTPLRLIPNHACGTVNMWSTMVVIDPATGDAVDLWAVQARH